MIMKDLSILCRGDTNSPAARPQTMGLEVDSAQFLKVGEPEEEKVKEKTVIVEEADKEINEASDENEDEGDI